MPIRLTDLANAAIRPRHAEVATLKEAREQGLRTAFLCHSHHDRVYAKGLVTLLSEAGWKVYIDWLDPSMPANPNRETGSKLKIRIKASDYFLFLATSNSTASRWCPWELGYADGVKEIDKILLVTTRDVTGTVHGNEYLSLYRKVDFSEQNRMAVWRPGDDQNGVLVQNL